jgi:hypothetical protein
VTAPEPGLPWREGTWWDCLEALTALSRTTSQRNLARFILERRVSKDRTEPFGLDRMRFRQIEALARLLGAGEGDASAETARLEATSILVRGVAEASRAALFALQDPLMAERDFAEIPTPGLRSLTVEDLIEVFDYEQLGGAAHVLAIALLGSAMAHDRFDDLRLGMRFMALCTDGRLVDSDGALHLIVATAQALLSVGCVSSADIETRVTQLRWFSRFLPVEQSYDDPYVQELAEELARVDADRFVVEPVRPQREDVIERLQTAYRASRHWAYLDDLIAYCDGARTDETPQERESRLGDLAVFRSRRAVMRHSLADHDASIAALGDAVPPGQASPFAEWAGRSFATNRAPFLGATGLPLYQQAGGLDAPDAVGDDELDLAEIPPEVALEVAIVSVRARMRRDGASKGDHREALLRAMAAAKAAEDGFAHIGFLVREAHGYGVIAHALYTADETPELEPGALAGLVALIAEPRAQTIPYEEALDAALTLLTERSDAFPVLRGALVRASALAHMIKDRDGFRAFAIYQVELCGILHNGDVLANEAVAQDAMLLATDLVRVAGFLALTNDDRRSSSRLLAQTAFLLRELALALCQFYHPEAVVLLAEMASGIAVGARVTDAGELTAEYLTKVEANAVPAADSPCVIAICGAGATVVVARPPRGAWEMTHAGTSVGAHVLGFAAEDMGSTLVMLRQYVEQLADFLRHLFNGAAELTTSAGDPVLYLPSGPPLLFASTLLRAGDRGLASTPPVVIGALSQRHADRAGAALSSPVRVAVLAGREVIGTSGRVDAAGDAVVIGASGCAVAQADGVALTEGLADATCVHYAGHLASVGPDETVLALTDSDVPLEAIRTLRLSHVKLVVLMACDTSQAPMGYSAEQCEHAAGAFLEAGAGAVIGTLWPVFDQPALIFTRTLYGALSTGAALSHAFDRAVDGVRTHRVGSVAPYAHPVYWGAFTLFIGPGVWRDPDV